MNFSFTLSSGDSLLGQASSTRVVPWPGGRGMLVVTGLTCTGGAQIVVQGVQGTGPTGQGWDMETPALSIGGVDTITTSGDYLIDLPPCLITFLFDLPTSDTLILDNAILVEQ